MSKRRVALVALRIVTVAICLAGCSVFSGWSDLQHGAVAGDGGRASDSGSEPEPIGVSPPVDGGATSDASPDAAPSSGDVAPANLPVCPNGPSGKSCSCTASCSTTCNDDACTVVVGRSATAVTECTFGDCVVWCQAGSQCVNHCSGGGCTFHCAAGAQCVNRCEGGDCVFACAPGACANSCDGFGCTTK